jgi:hypothetical protein
MVRADADGGKWRAPPFRVTKPLDFDRLIDTIRSIAAV